MLLGVLSDTHLVETPVPVSVVEAFRGVDMILHAGDILDMGVIEQLSGIAETLAVRGNMDHGEAARVLPEIEVVEVGGFRIGLAHGHGPPGGVPGVVRGLFEGVDCVVFGHTHQPHIGYMGGVLMFNPGSPTDRVFASESTAGLIEVTDSLEPRILYLDRPGGEDGA